MSFVVQANGTLSAEIKVFIDGELNASIHTSCSKPIGPGLISGDFLVVEGASRNGGPLCPVTDSDSCSECDGKVTKLTLQYLGDVPFAVIDVVQTVSYTHLIFPMMRLV